MFKSSTTKSKGLFGFSFTTIAIALGVLAYSMKWLENMSWYPEFLKDSTFLKMK
jgi:hypothetical protein